MVIANIPYFGAGIKIAPSAAPDDGLLDVVLMWHAPKPALFRVLRMGTKGAHVKLHQINTGRATGLTLTWGRSMPVGAHRESLDIPVPLAIRIMSNALRIIAPR